MLLLKFKSVPPGGPGRGVDSTREKVFLEHYNWLLKCALSMTRGQRERAEDLTHDVFVQFQIKDVDLAKIEDIRGYLNGILRNLHLLQLRRSTRHPILQLSLLDHDTAFIGLRVQDTAVQLQSLDLLLRACEFACYRKESSANASALILRFYHGYYPNEICRLLSAKRKTVDQWIVRGRNEAKEYLEHPYPLPELPNSESRIAFPRTTSSGAFLLHLRRLIFASCTTPCTVLAGKQDNFDVKDLAHLVSCAACLDRRSRKLGLPRSEERMVDEISDRDDGKPGDGSGVSPKKPLLRSLRKKSVVQPLRKGYARRREIIEHYPREISLTFDGETHATLLLNADVNTLNLSLDQNRLPNFIGILSDQDLCFLILSADDLASTEEQTYSLGLSDGRSLEATVLPGTLGPSIQVVYRDPFLAVGAVTSYVEMMPEGGAGPTFSFGRDREAHPIRDWWTARFPVLRQRYASTMTLAASALALGLAAALCFFFWTWATPKITPDALLANAERWEPGAASSAGSGVVIQKIRIKTPRRILEQVIHRDAQGIRQPKAQKLSADEEQVRQQLSVAGVNWTKPLSAEGYKDWRDRQSSKSDVVTRGKGDLLTLTTTTPGEEVTEESLTVRKSDFHPIARTIVLRNVGTVEIAELSYEVLPWGAESEQWFERSGTPFNVPAGLHPSRIPRAPHSLTEEELDEAELAVRLMLNDLHADAGEQLDVVRTPNAIQVKGIVETDQRKREIEFHLHTLPNVISAIFTVEEMEHRMASAANATSVAVISQTMLPSPLESYLSERGKSRDDIRQLSQQLLESALAASRDSKEAADLLKQFAADRKLSPTASAVLEELMTRHRQSALEALAEEERLLNQTTGAIPPASFRVAPPDSEQDLSETAERNLILCREMTSTSNTQPRVLSAIIPELVETLARMRSAIARSSSGLPEGHTAANTGTPPSHP